VRQDKAGWVYHIELARKLLAAMLGQPEGRVSQHMKDEIYNALLKDREQSTTKGRAQNITQRMN